MNLFIVESPTKAKTLRRYLDSKYKILPSYGHIRSLPSERNAVDTNDDFDMKYKILKGSYKIVSQLCEAAKSADKIFLATDPDREGEAISWNIIEVMKEKKALKKGVEVNRVVFHEITKNSILDALKKPRSLNMSLVEAQQARQALDYLVGFTLSPVLWRKMPGSRSAGRVQSVALKIICDREKEIDTFVKKEYWSIEGDFMGGDNVEIKANLHVFNGKKLEQFTLNEKKKVDLAIDALNKLEYSIKSTEKKILNKNPFPPFTTSTLIQESSKKLHFSAKKTMMIAQKLYEGIEINSELTGLITYMRTDNSNISKDSVQKIRDYILKEYGEKYLPKTANKFSSKVKNAQEAHEAIRPTEAKYSPKSIKSSLTDDQYKIYELIWNRTISSQMEKAKIEQITLEIASNDKMNIFKSTFSKVSFDGFYAVYLENKEDNLGQISSIKKFNELDVLKLKSLKGAQHFTQSAPRYTEASLVKKMEELGIGRPSTYPIIISILIDREYVSIDKRRFFPTSKGRIVDAFLNRFFSRYVEYDFTAKLENKLDNISNGEKNWKEVLSDFWDEFKKTSDDVLKIDNVSIVAEIEKFLSDYIFINDKNCNKCQGGVLGLKTSKFGPFLGCSNYPECNFKKPLFVHEDIDIDENQNEISKGVFLKKGPYGNYLESSIDGKIKRVSLPVSLTKDNISTEILDIVLSLPKKLGNHPDSGNIISLKMGRYGPYLECNKKFYALKKIDKLNISLEEAIEFIDNYKHKGKNK